jgi:hypothetical protein
MMALEIQEGKEEMATKPFRMETGSAGTAIILRLAQTANIQSPHRCVHGDSAFASVTTAESCLSHGLHFTGIVKTATSLFPARTIKEEPLEQGGTLTLTARTPTGKQLIAHAWQDKKRKAFIATCGRTTSGTPHVKKRYRVTPDGGEMEVSEKHIPRSALAERYFSNSIAIDVHNHLRTNLGLETAWATKKWSTKVVTAILGMSMTDAYLGYLLDACNHQQPPMLREAFVEKVCEGMLHSSIAAGENMRRCARLVEEAGAEAKVAATEPRHPCEFKPLHLHPERQSLAKKMGQQLKCSVCQTRSAAGHYCVPCSNTSKRVVAVCMGASCCREAHKSQRESDEQ